jgi:tetratricopeptide (TPR) repeat protein
MQGRLRSFALDHSGTRLAAALNLPNGSANVVAWETTRPAVDQSIYHRDRVTSVQFSPDGEFVLTACQDDMVRLFRVADGTLATQPMPHDQDARWATFSADGRLIMSGCGESSLVVGSARIWEAATGYPVTPPLFHESLVELGRPYRQHGKVVTGGDDWTVRQWPMSPDANDADALSLLAAVTSSRRLNADRELIRLMTDEFAEAWHDLKTRRQSRSAVRDPIAWHLNQSEFTRRVKQWHATRHHLTSLINLQPENSEHYYWRGTAALNSGHWLDAHRDFSDAIRLGKRSLQTYYRKGVASRRLALWEEAIDDFSQVLELDDQALGPLMYRADSLAELGKWEEALQDYQRVIAVTDDGQSSFAEWEVAKLNSGLVMLRLNRLDEFREICGELVRRGQRLQMKLSFLSNVLWLDCLTPHGTAETEFLSDVVRRLEATDRDDEQHEKTLAAALLRLGEFDRVVAVIEKGLTSANGQGQEWRWLLLAIAHSNLGNDGQAKEWLSRFENTSQNEPSGADSPVGERLRWDSKLELETFHKEATQLRESADDSSVVHKTGTGSEAN